jgi:hypothetical protein
MLSEAERLAIYRDYLHAFNTKSLEGIKSHLSPRCTAIWAGGSNTYEQMLPTYPAHWERSPNGVELLEIKAIDNNGVWTMLRDGDGGMDIEVDYFFDEEGLMILHDIKGVTYLEKKGEKGDVKKEEKDEEGKK